MNLDLQSILNAINSSTQYHPAPPPGAAPVAATPAPTAPPVDPYAAPAPQAAPQASILSTIGNLIAPQPGSFWAGARKNGLAGAKEYQRDFNQGQETARHTNLMGRGQEAEEAQKVSTLGDQVVGSSVVHLGPNGVTPIYTAPTEQERLIARWNAATDPAEKALLERAIKGYQYSDPYLQARGEVAKDVDVSKQKHKTFAPRVGSLVKPPAGFILDK